jgi:hypothetical protein
MEHVGQIKARPHGGGSHTVTLKGGHRFKREQMFV